MNPTGTARRRLARFTVAVALAAAAGCAKTRFRFPARVRNRSCVTQSLIHRRITGELEHWEAFYGRNTPQRIRIRAYVYPSWSEARAALRERAKSERLFERQFAGADLAAVSALAGKRARYRLGLAARGELLIEFAPEKSLVTKEFIEEFLARFIRY